MNFGNGVLQFDYWDFLIIGIGNTGYLAMSYVSSVTVLTYETVVIVWTTTEKRRLHCCVSQAIVAVSRHTGYCVLHREDDAFAELYHARKPPPPKELGTKDGDQKSRMGDRGLHAGLVWKRDTERVLRGSPGWLTVNESTA